MNSGDCAAATVPAARSAVKARCSISFFSGKLSFFIFDDDVRDHVEERSSRKKNYLIYILLSSKNKSTLKKLIFFLFSMNVYLIFHCSQLCPQEHPFINDSVSISETIFSFSVFQHRIIIILTYVL